MGSKYPEYAEKVMFTSLTGAKVVRYSPIGFCAVRLQIELVQRGLGRDLGGVFFEKDPLSTA
jgi:hypothetical protein